MSDDIREWAIANDIDLNAKGPIPKRVKEAFADAHPAPEGTADEPETSEIKPDLAKSPEPRSVASRLKRAVDDRKSKPKPKRASRSTPRVSVEQVLSMVWTGLAGGVSSAGLEGAGYIMTFQAPIAGAILEDAVKGTMIDKVLQPVARGADELRLLNALILPPLAAALMQMNPAWAPRIMVQLRKAMADWLEVAGPKIEKIQERELQFEQRYGEQLDKILGGMLETMWGRDDATPQSNPGTGE